MVNESSGYLPRLLEGKLDRALRTMRVVVLTGGRQTGKTTLAHRFGERTGRLLPIEVKAAARVSGRDTAGLRSFLEEHSRTAPFGLLVYGGDEVVPVGERILAVPASVLFAA